MVLSKFLDEYKTFTLRGQNNKREKLFWNFFTNNTEPNKATITIVVLIVFKKSNSCVVLDNSSLLSLTNEHALIP